VGEWREEIEEKKQYEKVVEKIRGRIDIRRKTKMM